MDLSYLPIDHYYELRALAFSPDDELVDQLRSAACQGMDPEAFHPDDGNPDPRVVVRCNGCAARLACLAFALRAEDPDARSGWYGGLGPGDRDDVAIGLGFVAPEKPLLDKAIHAARLRAAGWIVADIANELGCSSRTVQRYLRSIAA